MTDDNVRTLPDTSIILDLDAEERPKEDVKPPFVVKVEGQNFTFADPTEIDWRELADVETPHQLLRVALSKEDRKALLSIKLPGWKFNKLMESYYTHYDLEDKIADARRRANFS